MLDSSSHQNLLQALSGTYACIGYISLDSDEIRILHQSLNPDEVGQSYCYSTYLRAHAEEMGHISELYLERLMPQELKNIYQSGREHIELTMPDSAVKIFFYHEHDPETNQGSDWAYIYIKLNDSENFDLLRSITNEYLFKSCDYFAYIDPFRDSYVLFATNENGSVLPPVTCNKYSQEIADYARAYVPEEDQEIAVREMTMPRVIAELNRKGVHIFTCGVYDVNRHYTRKRAEFRYCDDSHTAILLIRTDITDLWNEEQARIAKLQHALEMAYTDLLTKVLNKQGFTSKAEQYLHQLKELNHSKVDSSTAILFIDLDNFKPVNDTYGHQVGDKVLQGVARILRELAQPEDIIGRFGGDEFVLLIKQVRNLKSLTELAQKIVEAMGTLDYEGKDDVVISCSLGAALAPQDGTDLSKLISVADQRLYEAKHRGKNMAVLTDTPEPATANEPSSADELMTSRA